MGGKKNNSGSQLGRAIIKDRFGKGRGRARRGDPTMVKPKGALNVLPQHFKPMSSIYIHPMFLFVFIFIRYTLQSSMMDMTGDV